MSREVGAGFWVICAPDTAEGQWAVDPGAPRHFSPLLMLFNSSSIKLGQKHTVGVGSVCKACMSECICIVYMREYVYVHMCMDRCRVMVKWFPWPSLGLKPRCSWEGGRYQMGPEWDSVDLCRLRWRWQSFHITLHIIHASLSPTKHTGHLPLPGEGGKCLYLSQGCVSR